MSIRYRYIPDSSEDEDQSDEDTYNRPRREEDEDPLYLFEVYDDDQYEPEEESDEDTEDTDEGDDESGTIGATQSKKGKNERRERNEITESEGKKEKDIASTSKNKTSKSKNKKKTKEDKYTFSPASMDYHEENSRFLGDTSLSEEIKKLKTPIQLFEYFFDEDIINMIVKESLRFATQNNKEFLLNVTELRQFIGILIYMSVIPYPTTRHYWNINMDFEPISSTMSCNRFEEIKRYIHFVNNEQILEPSDPNYDKLQKIRPFLTKCRERLLTVSKEEYMAVDEQIIPTKTRQSSLKQYNPKKPHKWGYKMLVLSGISGFSYDFDLYAGKQSDKIPENVPNLGTSSNVVLRLVESVPTHLNYKVYFDNWFTSIELIAHLHQNGILPLGTVRANRIKGAAIPSLKDMKKMGRGSTKEQHTEVNNTTVAVVSWLDNKVVNLCSSYVGVNPTVKVRRYNRKKNIYQEINCPKAVQLYNKHMGGVDTLDSMLGYYRIKVRTKKWYMKVFFHMIDLLCVNSWLLWRRSNKETYMPLLDFKLAIAEVLTKRDSRLYTPKTRGRPGNENTPPPKKSKRRLDVPSREIAEDGLHHMPDWSMTRQRCKNIGCKGLTFICCLKCKTYLCLNKDRNCFQEFHVSGD